MKRYVRTTNKKKVCTQNKNKGPKQEGQCWVCFKRRATKNLVYIGGNRRMCIEHDSTYQMFPLAYITNKRVNEMG